MLTLNGVLLYLLCIRLLCFSGLLCGCGSTGALFFLFVSSAFHTHCPAWGCQLTLPLTPKPQTAYEQWVAPLTSSDLS